MGSPIDELEGTARSVLRGARKLVLYLLAAGWTGIWLFILLFGWLFAVPDLVLTSGIVIGLTAAGVVSGRAIARARLKRRAEHALIARASLDRVKLDRSMEEILTVFDNDYSRIRAIVQASATAVGPEAELNVDRVRERLYQLAIDKHRLLRHVKQVSRGSRSGVVRSSIQSTEREISEKQREAERIVADVHRLATRLLEVQKLSTGGSPSAGSLTDVLDDLDRAASAYREIEEAESETERKLRALREARKELQ